jgi:ketosteroid isomerase-like protein
MTDLEKAREPEDLGRLFMKRGNSGDLEGIVSLYEPNAILAFPTGQITIGQDNIRRVYGELLAKKPKFEGEVRPALRNGEFALTSTRFLGGATAEVAHRQPDGTWLWIIDQPNIFA